MALGFQANHEYYTFEIAVNWQDSCCLLLVSNTFRNDLKSSYSKGVSNPIDARDAAWLSEVAIEAHAHTHTHLGET